MKNIIFRGIETKCTECGKKNWFFLGDIKEEVSCDCCSKKITPPLNFVIKYKLNKIFSNAYNLGVIPHILTLIKLKASDRNFYSAGLKIKQLSREIDIVFLDKDKLIIGECKNKGKKLHVSDFDSILNLSKKLNATKTIFSTMDDSFSKQIQKRKKDDKSIILLTSKDLIEENNKKNGFELKIEDTFYHY